MFPYGYLGYGLNGYWGINRFLGLNFRHASYWARPSEFDLGGVSREEQLRYLLELLVELQNETNERFNFLEEIINNIIAELNLLALDKANLLVDTVVSNNNYKVETMIPAFSKVEEY